MRWPVWNPPAAVPPSLRGTLCIVSVWLGVITRPAPKPASSSGANSSAAALPAVAWRISSAVRNRPTAAARQPTATIGWPNRWTTRPLITAHTAETMTKTIVSSAPCNGVSFSPCWKNSAKLRKIPVNPA